MPRMLFPKHSFSAQDSAATNEENTASISLECFPFFIYGEFVLQWEESLTINESERVQILPRGKFKSFVHPQFKFIESNVERRSVISENFNHTAPIVSVL